MKYKIGQKLIFKGECIELIIVGHAIEYCAYEAFFVKHIDPWFVGKRIQVGQNYIDNSFLPAIPDTAKIWREVLNEI